MGISVAFVFAALDRLFKMMVEGPSFDNYSVGWRYFAFERFHNPGIAFGLPIPLWLVLPLTLIFLIALVVWTRSSLTTSSMVVRISLVMIFLGALSNAFDRVTYGYTIDYLRLINAIINLADIMIIAGIIGIYFIKGVPKHGTDFKS